MKEKLVHEIFDELEAASTKDEKLSVLKKYSNHYALKCVLRGTFHPKIEYVVESVPYYSPSDAPVGMGYSSIHYELGKAYLFEKNNPKVDPNLTEKRKQQLLIQILESLEKREAEIFMNMLLKKQKVKGLTAKLVEEALPEVLI